MAKKVAKKAGFPKGAGAKGTPTKVVPGGAPKSKKGKKSKPKKTKS